jgi:hypothetical protein
MVAVGEIENKVLSKFQSRVHSHLQRLDDAARSTDLSLDFNKSVFIERQVIDESAVKNRKNPPENTNFLFQNDPQDVCLA